MNEPNINPQSAPASSEPEDIQGLPKMPVAFYAISILVLFFAVAITYAWSLGRAGRIKDEDEPSPKFFALDNKFIILEDPRLRVPWGYQMPDGSVRPVAFRDRMQDLKNKLRLIWTEDYWWPKAVSGLYRPLTTTTYLVNYSFINDSSRPPTEQSAVSFLIVNVFLHFVNSVLVFLVLALLVQRAWPAFLAALLWAVHPLCVETVVNIVGRADELACMFALTGFLCYYKLDRANSTGGRLLWMALCGTLLIIGISAKENTVAMIFMILLFDFVFRPNRRTSINLFDWLFAGVWVAIFMLALGAIIYISYAPAQGSASFAEMASLRERAWAYAFQYSGKLGMIVAGLAALSAAGVGVFALLDKYFPVRKDKGDEGLVPMLARGFVIVMMVVSVIGIWPLLDKWFNKKRAANLEPYWKWFLARVPMYLVLAVTVLFWLVGVRDRLFAGMREPELPFVDNPLVKYWEDGLAGGHSILSFVTIPLEQLSGKEVLVMTGEFEADGKTPKTEPWSFAHGLKHMIPAWLTSCKVLVGNMMLMAAPTTMSPDYSFNQIPLVNFDSEHWATLKVFDPNDHKIPIDPKDPGWQAQTIVEPALMMNMHWANWSAILALLLLIGFFGAAVIAYFRFRPVCFFILFLFLAMMPTSNLIFVMGSIQAERFLYIPTIAFCVLMTMTIYGIVRRGVMLMENEMTRRWALISVARALLMALAVVFLVRSFYRTRVWESDVTLWESAVTVCPNSFKTHKSLAYAWYERTIKNMSLLRKQEEKLGKKQEMVDHIIDEARKAIWATRKSQIVFVHLGAYLRIKGDVLQQAIPPPNSPLYKPELEADLIARAYRCYEESASVLESAKPLDDAFNARNKRFELKRGKSESEIADIGNYEIYWNLGIAYMRMAAIEQARFGKLIQAAPPPPDGKLNNEQQALATKITNLLNLAIGALTKMRHLAPSNVDAHLNLGMAYWQAAQLGAPNANDQAAVHFLAGWTVARMFSQDNRQDILQILKRIYAVTVKEPDIAKQPIIMGADGKEFPNFMNSEPNRAHFKQALVQLYEQFLRSRDRNTAAAIRDIGMIQCNFPPETFPPMPPAPPRANQPLIGAQAAKCFGAFGLLILIVGLGWFVTDRSFEKRLGEESQQAQPNPEPMSSE
jgi:hypothetical protein